MVEVRAMTESLRCAKTKGFFFLRTAADIRIWMHTRSQNNGHS